MKFAIVLLALVGLSLSAPQPRKLFHEHFDDFLEIIKHESGENISHMMEQYLEYEEFLVSFEYLGTKDFRDLVYELESLPEFQAVVEFLEKDNIDILFFIDRLNEMIDGIAAYKTRSARHSISGTDFNSYLQDTISAFPKDKLAALFDQKLSEDEQFQITMDNLQSEEWSKTFGALWESEVFQKEVQTLADHGINIHLLLNEIMAIFGQN